MLVFEFEKVGKAWRIRTASGGWVSRTNRDRAIREMCGLAFCPEPHLPVVKKFTLILKDIQREVRNEPQV